MIPNVPLTSLFSATLFMLLAMSQSFTPSAYAAPGEGTATISIGTGGTNASDAVYDAPDDAGTVRVGELSYMRIDLEIGATNIAPNEKNLTVQINTNLFPANAWDTAASATLADLDLAGQWFVDYADNFGPTDNTNIDFSNSLSTIGGLITIEADQQMDDGDVITLYAVVLDDGFQLAAFDVDIQTDDELEDNHLPLTNSVTIATLPNDANATITLTDPTVGATQNTTVNFTLPINLSANDLISFTLPPNVSVNSVAWVSDTFGDVFTCTDDGNNLVTCTATAGVGSGVGEIVFSGVTPMYELTAIDEIIDLLVEDFSAGAYIATDITVELTDTVPADTNATVELAGNSVVGAAGDTTLTLTVPFALNVNDTLVITFPNHLNVAGVGAAVTGTFEDEGNGGEMICAAVDQVVTCMVMSASMMTTGTMIMTGITSTSASETDVTSVEVKRAGNTMAKDETVPTTDSTDPPAPANNNNNNPPQNNGGGGGGYTDETHCILFGYFCPEGTPHPDPSPTPPSSSNSCDLNEAALLGEGMTEQEIDTLQYLNNKLEDLGENCITGYDQPTIEGKVYDWNGPLQRDQMAKIMSITLGTGTSNDYSNLKQFSDINLSLSPWFAPYLATLVPTYYTGYQPLGAKPYFAPTERLKNMHLGALVLRSFGIEPAQPTDGSTWYTQSHAKALQLNLLSGSPNELTTRGETFEAYARLFALVDSGAINGDSNTFDFEAFVTQALAK